MRDDASIAGHDLISTVATGLVVQGSAEVRARCAEEVERRLAGMQQRKVSESEQLALAALARGAVDRQHVPLARLPVGPP